LRVGLVETGQPEDPLDPLELPLLELPEPLPPLDPEEVDELEPDFAAAGSFVADPLLSELPLLTESPEPPVLLAPSPLPLDSDDLGFAPLVRLSVR
jgi:hypothetical protein